MKTTRIVSKILYYFTMILAIGYLATFAYSTITLLFKTSALNIVKEGSRFEIYYPFTKIPFLLGDYNKEYILTNFLSVIGLYGVFFWLLSNVFNVFAQEKLFTQKALAHLRRFYLANLTIPMLMLLFVSIISEVDFSDQALVAMHILLGVFAYFFAAIFKQGLNLQNEQNLFI